MTTTTHPAVAEYTARVQAVLADLPEVEVEEIVEDIRQHLAEVAEELGDGVTTEALTARLGTPEQYAAELRAAAGYPPVSGAPPARPGTFAARVALWGLVIGVLVAFFAGVVTGGMKDATAYGPLLLFSVPLWVAGLVVLTGNASMTTIAGLPEYRAFADAWRRAPDRAVAYLRSLRPAWGLIRIVLLAIAALQALRQGADGGFALPSLLAIVVLIWWGRRVRDDPRLRWIVAPANMFAVGVALVLLTTAWSDRDNYRGAVISPPGLSNDGRYIGNIYVFGPDGKPVPEAYLYDQNGQPINVPRETCGIESGRPTNKFPQPKIEYTQFGCVASTGVPFTVAIPQSSSTTTTTTTAPTTTTTAPATPPVTPTK